MLIHKYLAIVTKWLLTLSLESDCDCKSPIWISIGVCDAAGVKRWVRALVVIFIVVAIDATVSVADINFYRCLICHLRCRWLWSSSPIVVNGNFCCCRYLIFFYLRIRFIILLSSSSRLLLSSLIVVGGNLCCWLLLNWFVFKFVVVVYNFVSLFIVVPFW